MSQTIRIQKTYRVRLNPSGALVRVRLMAGALVVAGLALGGLGSLWPPARFESTQRATGRLDRLGWLPVLRGPRPLALEISGTTYLYRNGKTAMDSLASALREGDVLEVWSRPLPLARRELWQLSRQGQVLVPFAALQARERARSQGTRMLGNALLLIGAVLSGATWMLARSLRGLARRAGTTTRYVIKSRNGTDG